MKNGALRGIYEQAIKQNILCDNACYMCLAFLETEIQMENRKNLCKRRDIIAKAALKMGCEPRIIRQKIYTISADCFPSLSSVDRLIEMIEIGMYEEIPNYISNDYLKYNLLSTFYNKIIKDV